MRDRFFICAISFGFFIAQAIAAPCHAEPSQKPNARARPNILVIVSEDNGPHLGCYGDPYVKTPNLDRLSSTGMRFDRAYVPQAGCSQSRAAFLTGLYPHQNGQIGLATWGFRMFDPKTPNLVERLKTAGYRTGIIGKLHVKPEASFPFDYHKIPSANFRRKNLEEYARFSSQFFNESDAPFFLSVNYPDAHRKFIPRVEGLPKETLRAKDVKPFPYMGLDFPKLRKDTAAYYNCMSRLDTLVGDLLSALEESGKRENTLVIYFGDHGADLLRGKRTSYEGGIRVPLIIRWPQNSGFLKGAVSHDLVSTLDLAPTLIEIVQGRPIEGLPGNSLLPLLRGEETTWRKHLTTEFHLHSPHNYYPQRTIRDDRFKLIHNLLENEPNPGHAFTLNRRYPKQGFSDSLREAPKSIRESYHAMSQPPPFELYDLERDPFEFRNLASNPDYVNKLAELKRELLAWRKQTNDPFLDPQNGLRLQQEIAATKRDGKYQRQETWEYLDYLAPKETKSTP